MTPEHLHRLAAGIFHLALAATLTVTAAPAQAQAPTAFPTGPFLIQDARNGDLPGCFAATGASVTFNDPAIGEISGTPLGRAGCLPSSPDRQWTYDPGTRQLSITLNGERQCATALRRLTTLLTGPLILASCTLQDSPGLINAWTVAPPLGYPGSDSAAIMDARAIGVTWLIVDSTFKFQLSCPSLLTPPPHVRVYPSVDAEAACPGVAKPFVRFIPVTP